MQRLPGLMLALQVPMLYFMQMGLSLLPNLMEQSSGTWIFPPVFPFPCCLPLPLPPSPLGDEDVDVGYGWYLWLLFWFLEGASRVGNGNMKNCTSGWWDNSLRAESTFFTPDAINTCNFGSGALRDLHPKLPICFHDLVHGDVAISCRRILAYSVKQ